MAHFNLTIDTTQKINVTLTNPGDNPPTWTVESGDSTIVVAPDSLSADFVSSDFPGDTVISVTGTRGGALVNDSFTLTVIEAPPAQSFDPIFGTPVPKNQTFGAGKRTAPVKK
jgi:hypothetical protein